MQPAASATDGVKLMKGDAVGASEGMVNEGGFLRKRVEDVPVDQVRFFFLLLSLPWSFLC